MKSKYFRVNWGREIDGDGFAIWFDMYGNSYSDVIITRKEAERAARWLETVVKQMKIWATTK